jgi:hypothetical protein
MPKAKSKIVSTQKKAKELATMISKYTAHNPYKVDNVNTALLPGQQHPKVKIIGSNRTYSFSEGK